ncbi:hypothetical protein C2869_19255 [Saccharobesus litoralis]|uniref:Response regulatory domain-containing protein n=1 Tax=Saccharobesus litoralis TaxID=2172099 RepID=A0A2S0VW23_9ALTE|nr:response regulator [Saccharobesus litoralis]AWB68411.1 hypothetical protein C2869_19255 [Saccharobesus litoralis]
MKVNNSLATRHPKVILLHEHECDSGVSSLISSHIQDFRSYRICDEAIAAIEEFQPKILLMETDSIADTLRYYLTMVKEFNLLQYSHYVIICCSNKEAGLAYDVCQQGIFYDYFVTKPMYEKYRLKAILNQVVNLVEQQDLLLEDVGQHVKKMDADLIDLVEEAKELEQEISESIDQCRQVADEQTSAEDELNALNAGIAAIEQSVQQSLQPLIKNLIEQQLNSQAAMQIVTQRVQSDTSQKEKSTEELLASMEGLATDSEPENSQNSSSTPDIRVKKKRRVLLVEDNEIYRDMIKRILLESSFDVEESSDGLEALAKVRQHQYDLIVMDLFMPKLDGLNTTKQIRKLAPKADLPIIALTSNKNKEIVKKWLAYGISSYIVKPSKREQILSAVHKAFAE